MKTVVGIANLMKRNELERADRRCERGNGVKCVLFSRQQCHIHTISSLEHSFNPLPGTSQKAAHFTLPLTSKVVKLGWMRML